MKPGPLLLTAGVAFGLSCVLVYVARQIAIRRQLLDHPTYRSSHAVPTPRVGGVGIWMPWLVMFPTFLLFNTSAGPPVVVAATFVVSSVTAASVGLADDLLGDLRPSRKYVGQFLAALLLIAITYDWLLGSPLGLGGLSVWIVPVAFLAILWVTAMSNFANFMDGIDGLVGGIAIITFGAAAVATYGSHPFASASAAIITAASLGFLLFNRPPATIFMGDSGSLFLGFHWGIMGMILLGEALGSQALSSAGGLKYYVAVLLPLTLTAPIWVDSVATLLVRLIRRRPLTEAHRDHLYQRLVRAGHRHRLVGGFYWLYALLCAGAIFLLPAAPLAGVIGSGTLITGGFLAVLFLHRSGLAVAP